MTNPAPASEPLMNEECLIVARDILRNGGNVEQWRAKRMLATIDALAARLAKAEDMLSEMQDALEARGG